MSNTAIVCDTPHAVAAYKLASIIACVKFECKGLKHSQGSRVALAKRIYNIKGSKEHVLQQLQAQYDRMCSENKEGLA